MIVEIVVCGAASVAVVGYGLVRLVVLSIDMAGAFDSSADDEVDSIMNDEDDSDED